MACFSASYSLPFLASRGFWSRGFWPWERLDCALLLQASLRAALTGTRQLTERDAATATLQIDQLKLYEPVFQYYFDRSHCKHDQGI